MDDWKLNRLQLKEQREPAEVKRRCWVFMEHLGLSVAPLSSLRGPTVAAGTAVGQRQVFTS